MAARKQNAIFTPDLTIIDTNRFRLLNRQISDTAAAGKRSRLFHSPSPRGVKNPPSRILLKANTGHRKVQKGEEKCKKEGEELKKKIKINRFNETFR